MRTSQNYQLLDGGDKLLFHNETCAIYEMKEYFSNISLCLVHYNCTIKDGMRHWGYIDIAGNCRVCSKLIPEKNIQEALKIIKFIRRPGQEVHGCYV